jgi:HK97 family phage major capsid protein
MKHEKIEIRSALPIETREDDPLAVATAAVEELRSAAEQRHTAHQTEVRTLTDRLAAVETRLNRPGTGTEQRNEPDAEVRAFLDFARRGVLSGEHRALDTGTTGGATGGFLVPENFIAKLIEKLVLLSPVRQYASVLRISGANALMPRETDGMTAAWTAEGAQSSASNPAFDQVELTPYELRALVVISNQLLEDSAIDLEGYLSNNAAKKFASAEGAAFVNGNGTGKPKGFLAEAGIAKLATGNASTLGSAPGDMLISALYDLPQVYRANSVFGMNAKTLAEIRKLKDSQGNYLWQPGLQAGQPETVLGRPVIELVDMDDIAAGKLPIVIGDFSGYQIIDRVELQMLRDPYSLADYSQTRFAFRRRVGGGVTQADHFRLVKVAVS